MIGSSNLNFWRFIFFLLSNLWGWVFLDRNVWFFHFTEYYTFRFWWIAENGFFFALSRARNLYKELFDFSFLNFKWDNFEGMLFFLIIQRILFFIHIQRYFCQINFVRIPLILFKNQWIGKVLIYIYQRRSWKRIPKQWEENPKIKRTKSYLLSFEYGRSQIESLIGNH